MAFIGLRLALATSLLCTLNAAQADCVKDGSPVEGELQKVITRKPAGNAVTTFHIVLQESICVRLRRTLASEPVRHIKRVQLVHGPRELARFERAIGTKIAVRGEFLTPTEAWHTGDVLLRRRSPTVVPSRIGRHYPLSAPDIDDDGLVDLEDFAQGPTHKPGKVSPRRARASAAYRTRLPAEDINDEGLVDLDDFARGLEPKPVSSNGKVALDRPYSVESYRPRPPADVIVSFLAKTYLQAHRLPFHQIRTLYRPAVNYFGHRKASIDFVLSEKARFYRKWPRRRYQLISDSVIISGHPHAAGIYDVTFQYWYTIETAYGYRRTGRGQGRLNLDVRSGSITIRGETGRAING